MNAGDFNSPDRRTHENFFTDLVFFVAHFSNSLLLLFLDFLAIHLQNFLDLESGTRLFCTSQQISFLSNYEDLAREVFAN